MLARTAELESSSGHSTSFEPEHTLRGQVVTAEQDNNPVNKALFFCLCMQIIFSSEISRPTQDKLVQDHKCPLLQYKYYHLYN